MHIPTSVAWGGPGKKWIKIDDGWRECTDGLSLIEDAVPRIKEANENAKRNRDTTNKSKNEKRGNPSNFEGGMWIRVTPKSSREVAGYDCLGSFLRKLHLSKAGEKLGPFNYMLTMMELIIKRKLPELCGSAKRLLFNVIGDMVSRVLRTSEYIHEMRSLLCVFQQEIAELQSCFVSLTENKKDLHRIKEWIEKLETHEVPQRRDDGSSLIDMPLEVLQHIISFLDKYRDIESLSNVDNELRDLCQEERQWKNRCYRDFSESDIVECRNFTEKSWHDTYLQATKNCTRKVRNARCMLLCKTCGLMFWKGYGHPCLPNSSATSEPVSPEKLLYYFS